jgi:hypothetical protein
MSYALHMNLKMSRLVSEDARRSFVWMIGRKRGCAIIEVSASVEVCPMSSYKLTLRATSGNQLWGYLPDIPRGNISFVVVYLFAIIRACFSSFPALPLLYYRRDYVFSL